MAGYRVGALEGVGGTPPPPLNASLLGLPTYPCPSQDEERGEAGVEVGMGTWGACRRLPAPLACSSLDQPPHPPTHRQNHREAHPGPEGHLDASSSTRTPTSSANRYSSSLTPARGQRDIHDPKVLGRAALAFPQASKCLECRAYPMGTGGCGQQNQSNDPHNTTTSTTSTRRLLGAANAQTAHPATSRTAPTHQRRGSANAETTPAGAPAAAAVRKQRPDAPYEGKNG